MIDTKFDKVMNVLGVILGGALCTILVGVMVFSMLMAVR
jgi:hypothetical protein